MEVLSSPPCLSSFAVPRPAGPPCTPRLAPRSPLALGERPAALPAVHNSDGPSGHPLIFGRRCRRLPCSEVFLPGIRRLHLFRYNPSLRAAVTTPPEPDATSWLLRNPVLPLPEIEGLGFQCYCLRGLHNVRYLRPTASLPGLAAGLVRRHRDVLSPLQRVSSASWLASLYHVETFTRWVAPPFFWSRRGTRARTRTPGRARQRARPRTPSP